MFDSTGTRLATPARILKYRNSSVSELCDEERLQEIERDFVGFLNNSQLVYLDGEGDNTTWPGG